MADLMGYRAAFWVTSVLLLISGVAVHLFVNEGQLHPSELAGRNEGHLWDGLLLVVRSPVLRAVMAVQMLGRLASRVAAPMLPLFIQELGTAPNRLATESGLVEGSGALASAGGATYLGRRSDQIGHCKMLVLGLLGIAAFYVPQALVSGTLQLGLLQVVTGFLLAGVLAAINALLGNLVPEGRQVAVYGVHTTVNAVATAIGPSLGAAVAVWFGLRATFVVAAAFFLAAAGVALRLIPHSSYLPGSAKPV